MKALKCFSSTEDIYAKKLEAMSLNKDEPHERIPIPDPYCVTKRQYKFCIYILYYMFL